MQLIVMAIFEGVTQWPDRLLGSSQAANSHSHNLFCCCASSTLREAPLIHHNNKGDACIQPLLC